MKNLLKKTILTTEELEAKILQNANPTPNENQKNQEADSTPILENKGDLRSYKERIYSKYAKQKTSVDPAKASKLKGAEKFDYDSYFANPKTKAKSIAKEMGKNRNRINRLGLTMAVLLVILSAYVGLDKVMAMKDDAILTVTDTIPKSEQQGSVEVLPQQTPTNSSLVDKQNPNSSPEGVTPSVNSDNDYFINYRLEREKVRSEQLDTLNKMVESETTSEEVRKDAQKQILATTKGVEQELLLENMLVARYGGEAVVFVQSDKVNVVLKRNADKMTDNEADKIAQLIHDYTGIDYQNAIIVIKD